MHIIILIKIHISVCFQFSIAWSQISHFYFRCQMVHTSRFNIQFYPIALLMLISMQTGKKNSSICSYFNCLNGLVNIAFPFIYFDISCQILNNSNKSLTHQDQEHEINHLFLKTVIKICCQLSRYTFHILKPAI